MYSESFFPPKKDSFLLKGEQSKAVVQLIKNPEHIVQEEAKEILINSFISEYEKYLKPPEIGKGFKTWDDVRSDYEKYFHEEFRDFSEGKMDYWVQVSVDGKVVGWATFKREKTNSKEVYMNLLIVEPAHQKKGIGTQLVYALINQGEIPDLNAINLLLRKKNKAGREFYSKLGFTENPEYQRDGNHVSLDLLEPWTWKNPALQHSKDFALIP